MTQITKLVKKPDINPIKRVTDIKRIKNTCNKILVVIDQMIYNPSFIQIQTTCIKTDLFTYYTYYIQVLVKKVPTNIYQNVQKEVCIIIQLFNILNITQCYRLICWMGH